MYLVKKRSAFREFIANNSILGLWSHLGQKLVNWVIFSINYVFIFKIHCFLNAFCIFITVFCIYVGSVFAKSYEYHLQKTRIRIDLLYYVLLARWPPCWISANTATRNLHHCFSKFSYTFRASWIRLMGKLMFL